MPKKTDEERRAGMFRFIYGAILADLDNKDREFVVKVAKIRFNVKSKKDIPVKYLTHFAHIVKRTRKDLGFGVPKLKKRLSFEETHSPSPITPTLEDYLS